MWGHGGLVSGYHDLLVDLPCQLLAGDAGLTSGHQHDEVDRQPGAVGQKVMQGRLVGQRLVVQPEVVTEQLADRSVPSQPAVIRQQRVSNAI